MLDTPQNPGNLGQNLPSRSSDRDVTILQPSREWSLLDVKDLITHRELLLFLVWRDVKVRYKQTLLGVAWIVLQPVLSVVIYSILFGGLLNVPSGDVPYPLFALAALLPWQYFSGAVSRASLSLVNSSQLISKIYFPRLLVPGAAVFAGLVDFALSFLVLIAMMIHYRVPLTPAALTLPLFLLLAVATALAFSLWLSALNVRYRDITYLLPFLLQMWMYLTPVVYGSNLIPERFRFLLALNPMTVVVEGFRWALLGTPLVDSQRPTGMLIASVLITVVVLLTGLVYFRQTERTFADVV